MALKVCTKGFFTEGMMTSWQEENYEGINETKWGRLMYLEDGQVWVEKEKSLVVTRRVWVNCTDDTYNHMVMKAIDFEDIKLRVDGRSDKRTGMLLDDGNDDMQWVYTGRPSDLEPRQDVNLAKMSVCNCLRSCDLLEIHSKSE